MLQRLSIKNFAIISSLEIEFHDGLNVITGETGAGKSIILGALGLILGNRFDSAHILNPEEKCVIEGEFLLTGTVLESFFKELEIDFDENTTIRREVSTSGKSRAFVNDSPVTLEILQRIAENLIDIHSQYQTIYLNDPGFQLEIVDSFAETRQKRIEFSKEFIKFKKLESEVKELLINERKAVRDLDFLQFQKQELENAKIQPSEETNLEDDFNRLSNAENIKRNLSETISILTENEYSVGSQLAEGYKLVKDVSGSVAEINHFQEQVQALLYEVRELSLALKKYETETEIDAEKLENTKERLNLINHLLKKYNCINTTELADVQKEITEKVNSFLHFDEVLEHKQKILKENRDYLFSVAKQISEKRKNAVSKTETEIISLLKTVGIKNGIVKFRINEMPIEEMNEMGNNSIELLFSANPGIPALPVSKVASGGELSRLMLCVKYILTGYKVLPVVIFDEIDLGISGEIAFQVGQMMKNLSQKHQVISITHLPQTASLGDHHYLVYKTQNNDQVNTNIKYLTTDERVLEIAKMIGGDLPTESNIQSALELLGKKV